MKSAAFGIEALAHRFRDEPSTRLGRGESLALDLEDRRMNFRPTRNISRDDDDAVDHARLERLFGRRAHKAVTYRRIHHIPKELGTAVAGIRF